MSSLWKKKSILDIYFLENKRVTSQEGCEKSFDFLYNKREITVESLIFLKVFINGVEVSVLKDDGCNTYVVLNDLLKTMEKC